MKPPYASMWSARLQTIATIPCRLLVLAAHAIWWPLHEARHFLKWQAIGVALWACAILMNWVLGRGIDLSLLNPLTYSEFGWFFFVAWHLGWVWMWVNE